MDSPRLRPKTKSHDADGYAAGGVARNIAPHLDTARLGARARRYSAALLGFMALVTALMALGELRSGRWFHLAMALGLFVSRRERQIQMCRQPGNGRDHDADGSLAALEGVDVEDGLYSVYDADGRRIVLKGNRFCGSGDIATGT